ncbi:hypothetical protein LR48_Vigan01g134800 [Vigna angularis]|uniref:Uncharacterized protein n=1 Tax=Phaseolus angularis TaxID=3914 RepID=A0A0L9TMW0_PHAAN|nr:hypothetical protein LR48_Vigan01g134800 [Vigna angularis]
MEEVQGHGDGEQVGREMKEGDGEVQPEVRTQMEEVQGHGDGEQVGREVEEGDGEQRPFHPSAEPTWVPECRSAVNCR